jgi:hypothetical protein
MKGKILLSMIIYIFANIGIFSQKTSNDSVKISRDTVMYIDKIRFGIKLGGQISAVDEIHHGSNKRVPGMTIGATLLIPLQKKDTCRIFFAPEILYYQGGENGNDKMGTRNVRFYMDYIDFPLLIKGYFTKDRFLFVELGPKFSYLINHKNKDKDLSESNKFDLGLCLGGGISLGSKNNFDIGARLNYGLLDIYPDTKQRNFNIGGTIMLTYLF